MKAAHSIPREKHFLLFACCVAVKGYSRSVIYDLQRNKYKYIPNLLFDILELAKKYPVAQVMAMYNNEENEGIEAYFDNLEKEQLGFFTTTPEAFPPIEEKAEYPGLISNAILEYHPSSPYDLTQVLDQLEETRCKLVQLRYFGDVGLDDLSQLAEKIYGTYFYIMEVYIPYSPELNLTELSKLLIKEHRIAPLVVYGCDNPSFLDDIESQTNFVKTRLIVTSQNFTPNQVPEYVAEKEFRVNLEFYLEARQFNTGLNQKLCIDVEGNIKNHFSHEKTFGSVRQTSLSTIAQDPDFQKMWYLNNDLIETCKDCEFRYMCQDNSAIELTDEGYKKLTACGYDPYQQQWTNKTQDQTEEIIQD